MTQRTVISCDFCGNEIPLYHGAILDVLEQCHNASRVKPTKDRVHLDLCDSCYSPFGQNLQVIEDARIRKLLAGDAALREKK